MFARNCRVIVSDTTDREGCMCGIQKSQYYLFLSSALLPEMFLKSRPTCSLAARLLTGRHYSGARMILRALEERLRSQTVSAATTTISSASALSRSSSDGAHFLSQIWRAHSSGLSRSPGKHHVRLTRSTSSNDREGSTNSKRMSDSFLEVLLPCASDAELGAEYVNFQGGLRLGRLLEDLDALAASIAYLYCDDAAVTLVTAAVDRIDLLHPGALGRLADLRLRGMVTYVGRSSMEITMSIEMLRPNQGAIWQLGALAKFLFVARSLDGKTSVPVPRLLLETEGERDLFTLGQARHQYRLRRSETSLFRQPPTDAESRLLHQLLIQQQAAKETSIRSVMPMRRTCCSSLRICHPQDRNVHNFIFGGHLMREAFELAYGTALQYTAGAQPLLPMVIEDITFVHPVAIGSLINFEATIVYVTDDSSKDFEAIPKATTGCSLLHVEVIADVINPQKGTRVTTNTFHFTFKAPTPTADLPPLLPETYHEAMKYLEGKRRLELTHYNQQ